MSGFAPPRTLQYNLTPIKRDSQLNGYRVILVPTLDHRNVYSDTLRPFEAS
ncbi:MAG: hypothetical protein AAF485_03500 [Chloroflexota bacterium]